MNKNTPSTNLRPHQEMALEMLRSADLSGLKLTAYAGNTRGLPGIHSGVMPEVTGITVIDGEQQNRIAMDSVTISDGPDQDEDESPSP